MNRTLLPRALIGVSAAAALALLTSACSEARPAAATVNGVRINRSDFEDHLHAFVDNDAYQRSVAARDLPAILGAGGEGTVSMSFTGNQLTNAILFELVDQELAERGLTVTDEARQQAQQEAKLIYGSQTPQPGEPTADEVWAGFSTSFQDEAVENWASYLTLQRGLGGGTLDEEALRAVYDENPAAFGLLCARHILVASEERAEELKAELDAGVDFGELAASFSTDQGSAAQEGRLYTEGEACPSATGFVPEFVQGALSVGAGEVTDPVETQFGWHLIVVDDSEVVPFEEVVDSVRTWASQQASSSLRDTLLEAARGDITVAPRYGSWNSEAASVNPPGSAPTTVATSTAG